MDLKDLRNSYEKHSLDQNQVPNNPFDLFKDWMLEAVNQQISDPHAMTLATCDAQHRVSARIVLLKEIDEKGFVFFTNYLSHKAQDIAENPSAALVLWWEVLERQVRIVGHIEKIEPSRSEEYFFSRPVGSQIGAIVSPQSQPIPSRESLELKVKDLENHPENIAMPPHWGGYRLIPNLLEFWQGRPNRLHDRIQYHLENDLWTTQRLAP
ncbi:MAG: pyridoxamine 5'-phosphate oxidase [Saprospiraceae bacterium]|nr:pyridoxamine 5'-phosphate oxidase [Saprospiraceae bacterium]